MIRSLLSLLKLDFLMIRRDRISMYIVLAPALLSLVFTTVMANMEKSDMRLAVGPGVPENFVKRLDSVAELLHADTVDELEQLVEGIDALAGVEWIDGRPVLICEGNEPEGFVQYAALLVSHMVSGDELEYAVVEVSSTASRTMQISKAMLLLSAIVLSAAASGFAIVAEKEGSMVKALAISPIGLSVYVAGRTLSALCISLGSIGACALIMGSDLMEILGTLLVAISSIGVVALVFLLLGSFARTQIGAVAAMKLLMPIFLMVPITSQLVPETWRAWYYAIPMYWQLEAFLHVYSGGQIGFFVLMTLATSLIWFAIVFRLRKASFGFRTRG